MMRRIKDELITFAHAVMFFTRLPVPPNLPFEQRYLDRTSMYAPVMGWIVGGIAAGVFWAASQVLPVAPSVLLSMASTLLVTGAFHEDGLADLCDGFGGGTSRERVLEIMKDSRIGTFGAAGLGMALALKFVALNEVPEMQVPLVLVCGHSISRLAAMSMIAFGTYARSQGKSKPLSTRLPMGRFGVALVLGLLPMALVDDPHMLLAVSFTTAALLVMAWRIVRRLGGYTGDCLGAIQQVTEVTFYLSWIGLTQWTAT